jgi:hypothetical protein
MLVSTMLSVCGVVVTLTGVILQFHASAVNGELDIAPHLDWDVCKISENKDFRPPSCVSVNVQGGHDYDCLLKERPVTLSTYKPVKEFKTWSRPTGIVNRSRTSAEKL